MDFLVTNAILVDCQKKKEFPGGGVAVVDTRIIETYTTDHSSVPVDHFDRVIDAKGKYLIAGLFDIHSKSDLAAIADSSRISALAQGILTEVIGQDGFGVAPVSQKNYLLHNQYVNDNLGNPQLKWRWETVFQYLDLLHQKNCTNILFYAPHGTMRLEVSLNPVLSQTGLSALQYVFERAMDEGAIGLSVSTAQSPSNVGWNDDREMNTLLNILKKNDGVLCVNIEHSRNHLKDIDRAISFARNHGVRLHISRLAANSDENLESVLAVIDKRRKEVAALIVDVSPYSNRLLKLTDVLPESLRTLSPEELRVKVKRSGNIKHFFGDMHFKEDDLEKFKLITTSKKDIKKHEGAYLENIAMERDETIYDVILNLMTYDAEKAFLEYEVIKPTTLKKAFELPYVLPATTGYMDGRYLPDIFAAMPTYFNNFSKGDVCGLVAKLATLPSAFYKVKWGVKAGVKANFMLLDVDNYSVESDYSDPRITPDGVDLIVVNGKIAWERGKATGARTGEVLSWD